MNWFDLSQAEIAQLGFNKKVLAEFRAGNDSYDLAKKYRKSELSIIRRLAKAREYERHER